MHWVYYCLCALFGLLAAVFLIVGVGLVVDDEVTLGAAIFCFVIGALLAIPALLFYRKWRGKRDKQQAKKTAQEEAVCVALTEGVDKAVEAVAALPQVAQAEDITKAARDVVVTTMPAVVQAAFADGILTVEEEQAIYGLVEHYGITPTEKSMRCLGMVAKGAIIRDLVEGNAKPRISASDFPFNLLKSEVPIWVWKEIELFQLKAVKTYVRGGGGASFRIAKGVYYHAAGTRGHTETHDQKTSLGKGLLGVTNKHVIFQSPQETLRLKHSKIVRVEKCRDGVELYLDKAKPMWFLTDDSWFAANCIANATNW